MDSLWIVLGICAIFIVGAALPLLKDREESKVPKKETLRDWRNPDA